MKKLSTKALCVKALLIALVCISTMLIQIPVPATNGYIHLGDSMILIASVFFGWEYGFVAGSIGSGLADILTGYAHWAPFTFIIKGIMGIIIGKISNCDGKNLNFFSFKTIIASISGVVFMIFGYFICGAILQGGFVVSLASVPSNIVQGIGGLIVYFVFGYALERAKIYKYISVK